MQMTMLEGFVFKSMLLGSCDLLMPTYKVYNIQIDWMINSVHLDLSVLKGFYTKNHAFEGQLLML